MNQPRNPFSIIPMPDGTYHVQRPGREHLSVETIGDPQPTMQDAVELLELANDPAAEWHKKGWNLAEGDSWEPTEA